MKANKFATESIRNQQDATSKLANVTFVALGDPMLVSPSDSSYESCEDLTDAVAKNMELSDRKTQLQLLRLIRVLKIHEVFQGSSIHGLTKPINKKSKEYSVSLRSYS